jgi:YgiT-type zinc finger domain-containing protein
MKSFENCSCINQKAANITKTIRLAGQEVKVEDAPAHVCQECGEIYFDGKYILDLGKKIRLQKNKTLLV